MLRKRRWRVLVVLFLFPVARLEEVEVVVVEEEEEYTLDPDGEPWLEETAAGLEDDRASLAEEEHGSPEVEADNLGCLERCCSGGLLVTGVSPLLCSVHTLLIRFCDSSFREDLSGGFLLGCGAMRG